MVSGRHAPRGRSIAVTAAAAGVLTLLIRLLLHGRSFDLYGDEVVYTELGRSVISGGFPHYQGSAFFLHGPAFFYLQAGWARLTGPPPGLMAWVYDVRMLNGLLAGVTAAVLVLLAVRAGSLRTGVVVGLLFAVEPFCIRQNDRVLLETSMMLWVMLGYLLFIPLIGRPPSGRSWHRAAGAGLLFGCAVLTKDEAALLTVLPLLVAAALRLGPRRALTLITVGTTIAAYAVYLVVVAANGQFSNLWGVKTFGIQRMLGLIQITGFHTHGGGNLTTRLGAEAGSFATTYAILALAVPSLVILWRRGGPVQRLLGLLYCAAAVTQAYAVFLGTLEEQELYLLVVPSLLVIPIAASCPARRRRSASGAAMPRRKPLAIAMAGLPALAIVLNLVTFGQWLSSPDDAFVQLYNYAPAHIPAGARIAALQGDIDSEYALGARYQVGFWETPAALRQAAARYLVIEWGSVADDYADLSAGQAQGLARLGRLLFSASGRSYGRVAVYELPAVPAPRTGGQ